MAVKVLLVELDEENRERFFREQRAMGRLTGHPNIVTVLQVGATNSGLSYIVMPYHQQDSLDVRIRDHGPLPLPEALRLGVKMAGAVETAHRLDILHRDIKPANILLTDYGEPARPWPKRPFPHRRARGWSRVLYGSGAILASNRGCLSRMWNDDQTTVLRNEYRRILFELLTQAKQHGRIREDATDADLDLIFWSVRGVVATTRGVTDTGWRRILAVMIAGLRPGADNLDAAPMSVQDVAQIMDNLWPR